MLSKTKKRPAANTQERQPDWFEHDRVGIWRVGIWEAAEKWLHDHRVPKSEWPAWLLVLPDQEHVRITRDNWSTLVDAVLKPWKKSGYTLAQVDDDYTLIGTCMGLRLGVGLGTDGIMLHETADEDPFFRGKLSDTGYLNLAGLDARRTTPASLALRVRQEISRVAKRHGGGKRTRGAKFAGASHGQGPEGEGEEGRRGEEGLAHAPSPKRASPPAPSPKKASPAEPSTALTLAAVDAPVGPITTAERRDFRQAEATIERNKSAFLEMGRALAEIRDRRLYREAYATWEDYLRDRWGFGRQEAADKISAARLGALLSPISDKAKVPLLEDHLKALAPVAEAADVKAIYRKVLERSKREHVPVTGKLVREERRIYETAGEEPEKGRRGEEEKRAGATKTLSQPARTPGVVVALGRKEQEHWGRQIAELAEHVQRIAQAWATPQCRTGLAATLMELADQVEHLTIGMEPGV
ncbi:MAG: hypothetical protein ABSE84_25910 [Isosphaeraceae bacterium]